MAALVTFISTAGCIAGCHPRWHRKVGCCKWHGRAEYPISGQERLNVRQLRKLLGQLCWLSRPGAGLTCFMAGSYRALQRGCRHYTRSLGTVLLFCSVPQMYGAEEELDPERSSRQAGLDNS